MGKVTITNIHDIIEGSADSYIAANSEILKSTIPGPAGSDGTNGTNGANGSDGSDGLSAYDQWVAEGNVGTVPQFLASLVGSNGSDGEDGKSAYELWLDAGNVGDEVTYLNSLIGDQGADGQSVHHTSYTRSKDSLGNEIGAVTPGIAGNDDVYTVWDGQEETPEQYLGEFVVHNGYDGLLPDDQAKLDAIEDNATRDQTGPEIKILYEGEVNTNAFTDAEKTLLGTIETGATADQTAAEIVTLYEGTTGVNRYTDLEKAKLGAVEDNATADQTGAEIKVAYEAEADTNAFTDGHKSQVDSLVVDLAAKQDNLVSGTHVKTVNGDSIVGAGDLVVTAGSGGFAANLYFSNEISIIDGAYRTLSYVPDATEVEKTVNCTNGESAGDVYLFDLPIETTVIDAGKWLANFYCSVDNDNGDTRLRYEGFMKEDGTGTETTLFSATSGELDDVGQYREFETTQSTFLVSPTARYGIRIFASTTSNSTRTVSYTLGDGRASYTNTPLATRHDQLRDRDRVDSHPIEAITGLRSELDGINDSLVALGTLVEW